MGALLQSVPLETLAGVLEATTRPLIGCSFNLRGRDYSLGLQIQAFGDDQQILTKFPQRTSWRPLFGPVVEISQTFFPKRAAELTPKGI
jgi:hypothetical protein